MGILLDKGFLKQANAAVVHPGYGGEWGLNYWQKVRTASRRKGHVSGNLIQQASDLFQSTFDPRDYLLTHATIVASVDVFQPAGTKVGKIVEGGFRVNRKYGDYRIKNGCDKFINNNQDAWSRGVLLKSYQTFIGAHNFVEHVQIEDLSKGRIIDAAVRDIGDSVYVDILIATAKKHTDLIRAIESGKMSTLSMGCTVDGTICTKCGHWAADESEMCPHIKFEKGNPFYDTQGGRHRIAELCGHESLSPTAGVNFIEGSWVGTPAFTGAVMRNILEPSSGLDRRAQEILSRPPKKWDGNAPQKAAAFTTIAWNDASIMAEWGDDEEEDEGGEGDDPGGEESSKQLKELEDDLYDHMRDRVKKRIRQEMSQKDIDNALNPEQASSAPNDTLVKEGGVTRVYKASISSLVRTASSDAALINGVAALNQSLGIRVPVQIYRAALKVGGFDQYEPRVFLRACHRALGRQPSVSESKTMVRLGKIISQRGAVSRSGEATPGSNQGDFQ